MTAQRIILEHDLWRKGAGGAPAGLTGQADSSTYVDLDLDLAKFTDTTFAGICFTGTTFRQAQWAGCRFTNCIFSACDFEGIAIRGCAFTHCVFEQVRFGRSTLTSSQFVRCELREVNFDQGQWSKVRLLDCTGTTVKARGLRGEDVDFLGSAFEQLEFEDTILNSAM